MKKMIKGILGFLGFVLFGSALAGISYLTKKAFEKEAEDQKIYRGYYNLTNQWVVNKQEGASISQYFQDNNIQNVAIYGMGTIAELLYGDIKKTDVKVSYFIDKNAEDLCYGLDDLPVVGISDVQNQEKVDAIIVTPIHHFDNIAESLDENGVDITVISVEDIIYGA